MVVGDIASGTEVLVIGGGPGGYVAAIRAGQLGLDVTLVESDDIGGVCLNRGCIPSKALISASDVAHEAATAEELGITADPTVDLGKMVEWKQGVVDTLTGGVEGLLEANGVTVMHGRAEFADEGKARVVSGGEGEGAETVEFEHAIVATGSRPIEIPGFEYGDGPVIDAAAALELEAVPDRLVVVGAGYIGMELSTVFAKLGSDVTVVEMLDDMLPGYEADVARYVKRRANDLGIEFHFGQRASEWREADDGYVCVTEDEDGTTYDHPADTVLVAVGRQPVTDTLNLEAVGLEPDDGGFLETDDQCRTALDDVYAVGDVAGEPMLAHKASYEGEVAAEVIAGEPAGLDAQAIPAAVFTDPEIATVGLTEAEAEEAGYEPITGRFQFGASGRALTTNHAEGFVRVVADGESHFVVGAQIVGPEASELVAELALAIEMGARLEDVTGTVHTHPTLGESTREAALGALGRAIHARN
ncbi:MAG: dihydrolipoyl dehydrogenase [Halobacteriales archaeon]|nr:dihydrolipoyl dehydrogenase [Halobacteriales archaeon]